MMNAPFPDLPLPLSPEHTVPPLIEARGLSITKGRRTILDGVDLAVHDGEIITIVGPNGAGKSTLLRALMGLERPTRGDIQRQSGLKIGYLPQKLHLDPVLPLTVERLLTLTHRHSPAAVQAALTEVQVPHLLRAQVHGLSGGEMQRVLLARAILREPQVLFLDEPTQGVDYAGQIELYDLIGTVRYRHRCAVVMISHDPHVVTATTDRVVFLHHRICCAGRPETVTRHPDYLRLFGGAAAGHLAVYTHHHQHTRPAETSDAVGGCDCTAPSARPSSPHA
ncbi:ATP-binding cassette domain-containing protein [Insolitispirillum peregrinum]|uniref:ATP-binding cassette domain-containing protein n=1 Tax=Insolitispirillum peregrinum TaxID=80876 RepID=UPI0036203CA9